MSRLAKIGDWFEQRLKIWPAVRETAEHRVPSKSASWFYVFGSAALTLRAAGSESASFPERQNSR